MSKINIVALGGQNEIGKNMYVVEVDSKIFIFEAGLKYADDKLLGVDYIIPNYEYLKENSHNLPFYIVMQILDPMTWQELVDILNLPSSVISYGLVLIKYQSEIEFTLIVILPAVFTLYPFSVNI